MTPPADAGSNASSGARKGGGKGRGKGGGKGGGGQPRKGKGSGNQPRGGGQRGGAARGGKARGRPDDSRADELARPLQKVLERIPATQREVLEWRMGLKDGHPHDLSSTAKQLGLSLSETREIEQRAFEHIREVVPLQQLQKFLGS